MTRRLHQWMPKLWKVGAIASGTAVISTAVVALPSPPFTVSASLPELPDGAIANLEAARQGLLRSSRAIYTFAVNSYDYKYSLKDYDDKSEEYFQARSEVHKRAAERLLKLCQANRGFYVKAGQFVGSMKNVPQEFVTVLSVLQDKAQPWPYHAIQKVIEGEFGQSIGDIFAEFDEEPIAAASLAQVHRAQLKGGEEVAVKVQYPHLQQQFEIDIRTMYTLSKAISMLFPDYQFEWIVVEFEKGVSRELDFKQEGKNAEQTSKNFASKDHVKIPEIKWDLTSRRVLTMEFMHGFKITDTERLKKAGIDPLQVAEVLVEVFAEMVFCHGYVHGDPHPGNIFVHPRDQVKGKRNFDLVLLDHGLYRELDEGFRNDFCRLWKALILLDSNEMEELGDRLGAGHFYKYLPIIFTGRPLNSKSGLGRGMSLSERNQLKEEVRHFTMGDVSQFMEGLPRDFLTVLRTDGLLRSITSKLGATPRMRLIINAKYAVLGLAQQHRGDPGRGTQGWKAHTKAVYDYANLRLRLEMFELSYKFGLLYGSLLKQLRSIVNRTVGRFLKIEART
ncbi:aarF domain-containing kinase [Marchantia polymorpha subsp. ruderalis]|uniref:ABC1 atypical kinase-like domain-containing protein n=2 Tax=Marchantia polymorpha TaxID=3197 RepID=A0AAF6BP08_MARPO|nr:hypothetical protein MARPO_0097s0048 [Marchantia polymorpha]BBN13742.1 hypothetical protein Mp_6g05960 [Marchantia polymorpha subsp. ruderalis]|eukprot:PTQ32570.1 hypothetical protein MARPO_0097s0048 [Marchantia polymorpha]